MIRSLRALRRNIRYRLKSARAVVHPQPVFILGKEKSGTTAIATLLGELTDQETIIDIPPVWGKYESRFQLGRGHVGRFVNRYRYFFSKTIIKEPGLTFCYPALKQQFPEARYVLIVRDPRDNIRSVLNRVGLPGTLKNLDRDQQRNLPPYWFPVFDPVGNSCPGETWIGVQSHRWNLAADVYFKHPGEVLLIRYEDFLSNKLHFLQQLANRLEMKSVRDVSHRLDVQFQPRGDSRSNPELFFGDNNLAIINRICGTRMNKLGYQSSIANDGEVSAIIK